MLKWLRRENALRMSQDEARELLISGMDYAAYRETHFSLYESDKNRLFGTEHYNSGRPVYEPSPWAKGDFEQKMATLLHWASVLNQSNPQFKHAQELLRRDHGVLGRIVRRKNRPWWRPLKTLP